MQNLLQRLLRNSFFFAVAVSAVTAPAFGQQWSPERLSRLEALLTTYEQREAPGFGVGIIHLGEARYLRGFGLANLETGTSFTPETVSDIGSVAKQITCMGIVLLVQQGKLQLDDDIRKYLPEVPDLGHPITVRQLMHHTSGLREIYDMLALSGWQQGDGIHQQDALDLVAHSKGLNFTPGSRYSYCNTGYMLLGSLIARLGGTDFETWMRRNVFEPLGMKDTYIMDKQGELFPSCADSYTKSGNSWVKLFDNSSAYGQGGIYATIPDMLKWLDNFRTGKVGGKNGLELLVEKGLLNNGDTLDYALGIEHARYGGVELLQHTGSSAGYRTIVCYLPQQELGIILKSNYTGFDGEMLARKMIEVLLDLPAQDPLTPQPRPVRAESQPVQQMEAYTGRFYAPELDQHFEVFKQQEKLLFRSRAVSAVELQATGQDTFRGVTFVEKVEFERNKKQKVIGMRVSTGGAQGVWMQKVD